MFKCNPTLRLDDRRLGEHDVPPNAPRHRLTLSFNCTPTLSATMTAIVIMATATLNRLHAEDFPIEWKNSIRRVSRAAADASEDSLSLDDPDWTVEDSNAIRPARFTEEDDSSLISRSTAGNSSARAPLPLARSRAIKVPNENRETGSARSLRDRESDNSRSPFAWGTTIFSLTLILGLIAACAWILKKIQPLKAQGLSTDVVEVLGRRPLDQRQQIYLIRCGSRILVVGSSPQGMSTLSEITDPEEMDVLIGLCRRPQHESPLANSFQSLLSKSGWWRHDRPEKNANAPSSGLVESSASEPSTSRVGHSSIPRGA